MGNPVQVSARPMPMPLHRHVATFLLLFITKTRLNPKLRPNRADDEDKTRPNCH